MKYFKVIAASLTVVVAGGAIFVYLITNRTASSPTETTLTDQNVLQSQTNSEGLVTIKVTPEDLSFTSTSWDFKIVLDTHSGSLDQDLTMSAILIGDVDERIFKWELK